MDAWNHTFGEFDTYQSEGMALQDIQTFFLLTSFKIHM
jgi:hypothetical protein